MNRLFSQLPCFLVQKLKLLLLLVFMPFNLVAEENKAADTLLYTLEEIGKIYLSSMDYIFKNQPLINSSKLDKKVLFGQGFIDNIAQVYAQKFNQAPSFDNSALISELVKVMIEVMEDNRTLIQDPDIALKGFIPAVFAFQISEKLALKKIGLKIKFTNENLRVRNRLNAPDRWETKALNYLVKTNENWYFETNVEFYEQNAARYMTAVKLKPGCLSCHGTPANNPLNASKKPAQWTHYDKTGYPMEGWLLTDFGGAVSVTIYGQSL